MMTTQMERILDPFAGLNGSGKTEQWQISGLDPLPEEEWARMREFLALSDAEMATQCSPRWRRSSAAATNWWWAPYDYLLHNHETAAILGWEDGADPTHLAERRRFFTDLAGAAAGDGFQHRPGALSLSAPASCTPPTARGAPTCRRSTSPGRSAWSTQPSRASSWRRCPATPRRRWRWPAGTRCSPCTCT
jgi:hypothetical protein